MPSSPEKEAQYLIWCTTPLNADNGIEHEKKGTHHVVQKSLHGQRFNQLLEMHPNLREFMTKKGLLNRRRPAIHSEHQYTRSDTLDENLARAKKKREAVTLFTLLSPCVHSFCAEDIGRVAKESGVPHYVVFRHQFAGYEGALELLTQKRVPVFQVIGERVFFRNRENFFEDAEQSVTTERFYDFLRRQQR